MRAGRSETDDETLTSDECSEEDCDYECSECLGRDIAEKNGAEWIRCGCGQWIHEDCIDQAVPEKDGKGRLCSNCVLQHFQNMYNETFLKCFTLKHNYFSV